LIDPSSTNMSILQALGNVKIGVLFYN
jgi:hypothetical protein